jgi:hypothetical protein
MAARISPATAAPQATDHPTAGPVTTRADGATQPDAALDGRIQRLTVRPPLFPEVLDDLLGLLVTNLDEVISEISVFPLDYCNLCGKWRKTNGLITDSMRQGCRRGWSSFRYWHQRGATYRQAGVPAPLIERAVSAALAG